jgi:hypothetical protein
MRRRVHPGEGGACAWLKGTGVLPVGLSDLFGEPAWLGRMFLVVDINIDGGGS